MLLVMLILALVSAGALGLTYTVTADLIAANALEKQKNALATVLPEFSNDPVQDKIPAPQDEKVFLYPAMANGSLVGIGVQTYSEKAFGGVMTLMVGFTVQGELIDTQVLSHTETPGLGSKISEPSFAGQFRGRTAGDFPLLVSKDGGQVDAITAATISSRAYVDGLNRAYQAATAYLEGGQ
jgi:electron transport complex protein RnfG